VQTCARLAQREIDKTIAYGGIYKKKKLLGIVVLGLLKSYPIDYRKTCTRLVPREIKPQFSLVKILMLA